MMGRPPKPPMTEAEYARAVQLRATGRRGGGWQAIAAEISLMRGAHMTGDGRLRHMRAVSKFWVARQMQKKSPSGRKVEPGTESIPAEEKSPSRATGAPEWHQEGREPTRESARVRESEKPATVANVEVAAGGRP